MENQTTPQIKELIDNYAQERVWYMMFITERGLAGDFVKWMNEKTAQIKQFTASDS
jgi:hypothetical protein